MLMLSRYIINTCSQHTAEADGNVSRFAGIWSETKVLDTLKFWPDGGAKEKVRGLSKFLQERERSYQFRGVLSDIRCHISLKTQILRCICLSATGYRTAL